MGRFKRTSRLSEALHQDGQLEAEVQQSPVLENPQELSVALQNSLGGFSDSSFLAWLPHNHLWGWESSGGGGWGGFRVPSSGLVGRDAKGTTQSDLCETIILRVGGVSLQKLLCLFRIIIEDLQAGKSATPGTRKHYANGAQKLLEIVMNRIRPKNQPCSNTFALP